MRTGAFLALTTGGAAAATNWEAPPASYAFADYTADFAKSYASPEEAAAKQAVFETNLATIRAHNSAADAGAETWRMGLNEFADLTPKEFAAARLMAKGARSAFYAREGNVGSLSSDEEAAFRGAAAADVEVGALPASVDWRTKNVVTPVKNQGGCGSCWAFSTAETLESHIAIATGKLFVMSPQQVVDCAPNPQQCGGSGGCQGSTPALLFAYAKGAGAVNETSYPYTAKDGTCAMKGLTPTVTVGGHVETKENDYDSLMAAVAINPVTIAVAAAKWGPYSGGVLSFNSCDADLDHAVLLVGYGTDAELGDYWKVQNSWGAGWGEEGFIRLARSAKDSANCKEDTNPGDGMGCAGGPSSVKVCGTCGILYAPSYPVGVAIA